MKKFQTRTEEGKHMWFFWFMFFLQYAVFIDNAYWWMVYVEALPQIDKFRMRI